MFWLLAFDRTAWADELVCKAPKRVWLYNSIWVEITLTLTVRVPNENRNREIPCFRSHDRYGYDSSFVISLLLFLLIIRLGFLLHVTMIHSVVHNLRQYENSECCRNKNKGSTNQILKYILQGDSEWVSKTSISSMKKLEIMSKNITVPCNA